MIWRREHRELFFWARSPKLHMKYIHVAPEPTLKIFSLSFNIDCEEIPLQLPTELYDLLCFEDLKSLACYVLDVYKNHVLPFGRFLQPFFSYTQKHPAVNSCSRKLIIPTEHWIRNCYLIPCLVCSCKFLHLTLIIFLFVIRCLINKSWLLPWKLCRFN